MDADTFGKFIVECRKENNLTQAELGKKLSVTAKAVSRWERGLGFPDINTLEPLAEALNVSVHELMRAEKKVTNISDEDTVNEALHNTLEVADEQIQNAEKRGIIRIIGAMAVLVLTLLVFDNMPLIEFGLVAAFVYIPLVCLFSALILFMWALYQKKKGNAYKKTIILSAILAGIIVIFALTLFVAGMFASPTVS
ncbi:MAG: helix-turn-helix transcriptional regulator [Pseudobutyrivibrio sp.]|nr:helix-turn-helix transcriptional regulator [Pseudobutyrivibrio sp.]